MLSTDLQETGVESQQQRNSRLRIQANHLTIFEASQAVYSLNKLHRLLTPFLLFKSKPSGWVATHK